MNSGFFQQALSDIAVYRDGFRCDERALSAAGRLMFRQAEVCGPMFGHGDLAVLKDFLVQRFLVMSGFRRTLGIVFV